MTENHKRRFSSFLIEILYLVHYLGRDGERCLKPTKLVRFQVGADSQGNKDLM